MVSAPVNRVLPPRRDARRKAASRAPQRSCTLCTPTGKMKRLEPPSVLHTGLFQTTPGQRGAAPASGKRPRHTEFPPDRCVFQRQGIAAGKMYGRTVKTVATRSELSFIGVLTSFKHLKCWLHPLNLRWLQSLLLTFSDI